jgi:hypothetical protein
MKRKLLMSAFALAMGAFTFAQEAVFNWVSPVFPTTVNRKTRSQIYDLERNAKNEIFVFGHFGSLNSATLSQTFLGRTFTGAAYGGTSSNRNLLLSKVNAKGELLWAVHSDGGDVDTGASAVIPTRDGGAFLALKVRHADKNADGSNKLLEMVDQQGTKTTLTWDFPENEAGDGAYHTIYQGALVKLSATGEVEKLERIAVDFSAQAAAGHYDYGTPDAFYFYGGAEDSMGNVYIAGNVRKPMTIDGTVITPHNTTTWDGDSQKGAGCSFVVKLDEDGNYVKHLLSTGVAENDGIRALKIREDRLYIAGFVQGKAKDQGSFESFGLGTETFTPNAFKSAFAARLTTDLAVDWMKFYPFANTQSKKAWKIDDLAVSDAAIYICGAISGSVVRAEGATEDPVIASSTKWQNGYVLKCSTATGEIEQGYTETHTHIGNTSSVICGKDNVYTFNYKFGKDLCLNVLSKDLTFSQSYALSKNGGFQTSYDIVGIGDTIMVSGVVKKSPEFYKTTTTFSETPQAYTAFVGAWTFPGKAFSVIHQDGGTGVEAVDDAMIRMTTVHNVLKVNTATATQIEVYSLTGECVAQQFTSQAEFRLPQGVYLVCVNGKTYKALVRR